MKKIKNPKKFNYSFIKKIMKKLNVQNSASISIDPEEDDIIIFPSKTAHSTMKNLSNEERISISGDISIMLKNSNEFEHLLPNPNLWQRF